MKTLAIVSAITLVAQTASAQIQPNLPSLRAPTSIRSQVDRDIAPSFRPQGASQEKDIARVVPVKCKKPTGKFPWNFDKVKVTDIVDQISRLTCRNFIVSSAIKSTQEMSILSRTPVTVEQAWQAFLSALESNELALVEAGSYYKIVKRADSIRQGIPLFEKREALPNNEGMVTMLYDLRNISKEIAQSLVKGMISRTGDVLVVGESFLVISDSSSNIRRILRILEKVDIPGAANRIHIVDLTYADATQIQQKINEIFDTKGSSDRNRMMSAAARAEMIRSGSSDSGSGSGSFSLQKIVADERTNKLIVIASDRAYDRIKEIIDVLDVPSSDSSSQGQINVYYLKNGDSKKLATTLSTLVQGSQSARGGSSRPGSFRPDSEAGLFEGEIKITADESTNSLVVVASPRDYKAISQVIAKLDKVRTQVYVEAVIMEIGINETNKLGLKAYGGVPIPSLPGGGGLGILANPGGESLAKGVFSSFAGAQSLGPVAASGAALGNFISSIGIMGLSPIPIPGGGTLNVPSVGFVLEALQTYSNVEILSNPSLTTLDNEKAEIAVGEKVPTLTGVSAIPSVAGGASLGTIQNITYQDVKLKFGITPHVNDDNNVRLEIEQEVNELGDEVTFPQAGTQWRIKNKSTKTVVMAKDQQTIVIGGLIDKRKTHGENKFPLLGDIPIIGWLFKNKSDSGGKKNLLLVLTPYVIRSDADIVKIYERKNREHEEFGKLYFGDKITRFDPYVDYEKKTGPLGHIVHEVETEMQKIENGGPGLPGETVIKTDKPADNDVKLDITVPVAPPGPPEGPGPRIDPESGDDDFLDDADVIDQQEGMAPPPPSEAPMPPTPPPPIPPG